MHSTYFEGLWRKEKRWRAANPPSHFFLKEEIEDPFHPFDVPFEAYRMATQGDIDFWAALEAKINEQNTRGTASLLLSGDLEQAARALLAASNIAILTGFPCLMDFPVPTETDGLLGSFALAKTLSELEGKRVRILTDTSSEQVLRGALFSEEGSPLVGREGFVEVLGFEPPHEGQSAEAWLTESADGQRLSALREEVDCVVCIERSGLNKNGDYLTMSGRKMNAFVAPLEKLLEGREDSLVSIGVGDGGNELGMGKLLDAMLSEDEATRIPLIEEIACVVPATFAIVCSVCDWGGFALAAGVLRLLEEGGVDDRLLSTEEYRMLLERCVSLGARDGITKEEVWRILFCLFL